MTVNKQIQRLLSQKWAPLDRDLAALDGAGEIGVYLIACSERDLAGEEIDLQDIFYVGMSNARVKGMKDRVKHFLYGIEKGEGHSGGNRFFRDYLVLQRDLGFTL